MRKNFEQTVESDEQINLDLHQMHLATHAEHVVHAVPRVILCNASSAARGARRAEASPWVGGAPPMGLKKKPEFSPLFVLSSPPGGLQVP